MATEMQILSLPVFAGARSNPPICPGCSPSTLGNSLSGSTQALSRDFAGISFCVFVRKSRRLGLLCLSRAHRYCPDTIENTVLHNFVGNHSKTASGPQSRGHHQRFFNLNPDSDLAIVRRIPTYSIDFTIGPDGHMASRPFNNL